MKDAEEVISTRESNLDSKESFWELARFAIIALAVVIPIRVFVAQPFSVSGSSMVPTFENYDYLIVDEISYRFKEPERYDIVIFKYPNDPKKYFIKRIIGLPNETVNINDNEVTITNAEHKEGFKIDQPYVKNVYSNNIHFELKDEEYFVMGDNRSASSDSRYWGAVPRKLLVGRAFVRLWPLNKMDLWPGGFESDE